MLNKDSLSNIFGITVLLTILLLLSACSGEDQEIVASDLSSDKLFVESVDEETAITEDVVQEDGVVETSIDIEKRADYEYIDGTYEQELVWGEEDSKTKLNLIVNITRDIIVSAELDNSILNEEAEKTPFQLGVESFLVQRPIKDIEPYSWINGEFEGTKSFNEAFTLIKEKAKYKAVVADSFTVEDGAVEES